MSFLARFAPSPLSSVALFAAWLALSRSTDPGGALLGLALALAVPVLVARLHSTRAHARKPLLVARFILVVCHDVLRSNFLVAWDVATWRWRPRRSKFVVVPLELRDPVGLAALCMVTTIVPGTVWSELALDRSKLLLHVWHVEHESTFVEHYKARYERPLREIFE